MKLNSESSIDSLRFVMQLVSLYNNSLPSAFGWMVEAYLCQLYVSLLNIGTTLSTNKNNINNA